MRQGSCHCGAVKFEADVAEPMAGSRCNCSICAMKGSVGVYVSLAALQVVAGGDQLSCYSFNTDVAKHYFCRVCGIHCYHQTRSNPDMFAINAATLAGVRPYEDFPDVAVADGQRHALDNNGVRYQAGILRFDPSPEGIWRGPNNLSK